MKGSTLGNLLVVSADHWLSLQKPDGSFPHGHNGPYHDQETPVRNTAHFLFLLADLFRKTGEARYKEAGERAVDYLFSPIARPGKSTFHIRDKAGKDHCNGLVGQAWVIEALVVAGEVFDRQDCYDLAEEVFLLHPWDGNVGIWQRVESDGTALAYDGTFNHQLWFAAAGSMLVNTPPASERSLVFLKKVAARVQLYSDNVIFHSSPMGSLANFIGNGPLGLARECKSRLGRLRKRQALYSKSVGYHGFNLYAYAMLQHAFPNEEFWGSDNFKRIIRCPENPDFQETLKHSEYGYFYNVSGIEIAYAVETFLHDRAKAGEWIKRQFEQTWQGQNRSLTKGAADENTAIARTYQAARLAYDYEVNIEQ